MVDYNGTRAYHVAYPGTTYGSARTLAGKLLTNVDIKKEIAARRLARQKRTGVSADAAIEEARRIAFADPLYLFEDDGVTPRKLRDVPPETRRAVLAVKVRRERVERRTIRAGETTVEL